MATKAKSANLDLNSVFESATTQFRGLNPNEPGQWPWLPKATTFAVLTVLVVVAGWFLLLSTAQEELDAERAKEPALKQDYRAKLAHEDAHRRGGVPLTIVRSTQFHDFPGQLLSRMTLGRVAAVPRMAVQPVDSRVVAGVVVDAAERSAPEPLVQVGGPQVEDLVDLAQRLLVHRGERRRVLGLNLPGAGARALRAGALLPGPDATLAGRTFADWLAEAPR